jgi:hypothetical protein
MDPNANAAEQETIMNTPYRQRTPVQHARLRELRRALDDWRAAGGYEPDWIQYPHLARRYMRGL